MVEDQARLDTTFSALADATRRSILARLAGKEMTVGEVARPYPMSLAAVSKHLHVLSKAGLVRQQRDGRIRRCRLDPKPLIEAADWIEDARSFWTDGFEALAEHLKDVTRGADPGDPQPEDEENDQ
jgi:DNA-binding transcriptional ArsR family regulator